MNWENMEPDNEKIKKLKQDFNPIEPQPKYDALIMALILFGIILFGFKTCL